MKNNDSRNITCINDTLSFIEKNYDQVISIEQLEEVSHYSYRNIQRIFRYSCGETIGNYQKRLKLENAYKMMLYTNCKISVIALKVGFANSASFSKAFKLHFGITPFEAKRTKIPLFEKGAIVPNLSTVDLNPTIVYVPLTKVYFKGGFMSYEFDKIELLWDEFLSYDFPLKDNEYYGIIADEPLIRENLKCRYDTCSTLPSSSIKMPSKTIGGGKYAQFIHYGSYEKIEETYAQIYSQWILNTKLEFGCTPIIEKYVKHPDNSNNTYEQETYIWLPLI
ncbi:AraC family transcriptional regulator [Sphingobacterium anhuiense]|uniref:GyrI-like domain-containing protein n=1 Tax=Sphingobacterium anhuiense TaxID=493780 RepID=A0ABW5YUE5_9SPHI